MAKKPNIEEIYKEMDEITHVLSRPGMYVGSIKDETRQMFVYDQDEAKMTLRDINYVPAMLKAFDEILSNSCDEYRRKTNLGLNRIDVIVKDNEITVFDNGGIPIVMHKEAKCYVPEFIFGRLRTSSNYNDDEDRQLIGTNGVGSVLANIFSSNFIVESADGKNSFYRSWSNNMRTKNDDLKVKKCKNHYTKTTFTLDLSKFDVDYDTFQKDFIDVIEKRCIDAAAANFGLTVTFSYINSADSSLSRSSKWKFKKFEQYIEMFDDFIDMENCIKYSSDLANVWIFPGSNINVGFVDGAECSRGTHINIIRYKINKTIQELLEKKKMSVTLHNVDNKYSLFCDVTVSNPAYDSQTKECLTTPVEKFSKDENIKFVIPEDFLKKISKSEIVELVKDWFAQKQSAEDNAKIRKMNRESGKLLRNDKFINCASKRPSERQLWIFEGDSAASGFRQGRDPMTQAGYLMRGVPLNTIGMKPVQIMKNQVLNDIIKILGLKWGEYNKKEDLKYQKIVISTDMDYDGHKIAALLLVFFNHFPELFEQKVICRILSPIIIATKGSGKRQDIKKYYSLEEYRQEQNKLKGYEIKYIKGLGGQNVQQYKEMMQSNNFEYYIKDDLSDMILNKWFGKGIASVRKDMLKEDVEAE